MLPIIKTADEFVKVANEITSHNTRQYSLSILEAEIILGYLEGSDYSLLHYCGKRGEEYFVIHDNQDTDEDSGERCYSLHPIAEYCNQLCWEILSDAMNDANVSKDYLAVLERDEFILERFSSEV